MASDAFGDTEFAERVEKLQAEVEASEKLFQEVKGECDTQNETNRQLLGRIRELEGKLRRTNVRGLMTRREFVQGQIEVMKEDADRAARDLKSVTTKIEQIRVGNDKTKQQKQPREYVDMLHEIDMQRQTYDELHRKQTETKKQTRVKKDQFEHQKETISMEIENVEHLLQETQRELDDLRKAKEAPAEAPKEDEAKEEAAPVPKRAKRKGATKEKKGAKRPAEAVVPADDHSKFFYVGIVMVLSLIIGIIAAALVAFKN